MSGGPVFWKAMVVELGQYVWLGVIRNARPGRESRSDPTAFGWQNNSNVWIAGKNISKHVGWAKVNLHAGDECMLKLEDRRSDRKWQRQTGRGSRDGSGAKGCRPPRVGDARRGRPRPAVGGGAARGVLRRERQRSTCEEDVSRLFAHEFRVFFMAFLAGLFNVDSPVSFVSHTQCDSFHWCSFHYC